MGLGLLHSYSISEQLFIFISIITLNIFGRYNRTVRLKEMGFHPVDAALLPCSQQMKQVQSLCFRPKEILMHIRYCCPCPQENNKSELVVQMGKR